MTNKLQLKSISDDDLLRRLSKLLRQSRRVESELVAHIGEVDSRRLFAGEACPSMFAYCTDVLHLSEHEAYLRIAVGRASREYPDILVMLEDGRLHLSGIAKLAPHMTEANRESLLARAAYKSKRQIEELVAEISPEPDVPTLIRKLPERREKPMPRPSAELGPDQVASPKPKGLRPVEPLAPARYKVQFTASSELHAKLERVRALMPHCDLAAIIDEAVTEKLERLESKRFAKAKKPRKGLEETDTSPSSRYVPAAVKRAVRERDEGQCAFVQQGKRCAERARLQFHHRQAYARGGDHSPENLELMCPTHNIYLAEGEYGKAVMERYRPTDGHAREPAPVYF